MGCYVSVHLIPCVFTCPVLGEDPGGPINQEYVQKTNTLLCHMSCCDKIGETCE